MNKIKWPGGSSSKEFMVVVHRHAAAILGGTLVAVDPSSTSAGYAVYQNGIMTASGTVKPKSTSPVQERLRTMYDSLAVVANAPDVVAIEKIRGTHSHEYLKWSIGVSISAVRAPIFIEVPITFWKAVREIGYIKTDEMDARQIGNCLIMLAKELTSTDAA